MTYIRIALLMLFLDCFSAKSLVAATFLAPELAEDNVIGEVLQVNLGPNETLQSIARRFDLGRNQVLKANPNQSFWVRGKEQKVILPTLYILPKGAREGIILNLAEQRLYYFDNSLESGLKTVLTFPVTIGTSGWETPAGLTKVIGKVKSPNWYPPESIRNEARQEGKELPEFIPGGTPDNPLGDYSLRLDFPGSYLIHGTNALGISSIGSRSSHGCIRLYPEDIEQLYNKVTLETPVLIVNQVIKIGLRDKKIYLEFHAPLNRNYRTHTPTKKEVIQAITSRFGEEVLIDSSAISKVLVLGNGIPVEVGNLSVTN